MKERAIRIMKKRIIRTKFLIKYVVKMLLMPLGTKYEWDHRSVNRMFYTFQTVKVLLKIEGGK